jgi:hypothetical protein
MNQHVYNIAVGIGIVLTATGIGLWSVPAGMTAAGVLILGFTVYGAELARRAGRG